MHELAIAEGIADVVTQRAREMHAARVRSVRLRVGEASGVVPAALTFSFAMLTEEEPLLAGAELVVETVPHRAHCRACDRAFDVQDFIAWCPTCGAWSDCILSGTELQVVEMEIVETAETAETAQVLAGAVSPMEQQGGPPEEGEEGRAR